MKVVVLVDGKVAGKVSDEQVTVDSEMGDTVEDVKVKVSLLFVAVDPDNLDLFYNSKRLLNSENFSKIGYDPSSMLYCRKRASSCCLIF